MVRACLYDPDISPLYAAFARHWGFVPLSFRPRHPEDNGIEERSGIRAVLCCACARPLSASEQQLPVR